MQNEANLMFTQCLDNFDNYGIESYIYNIECGDNVCYCTCTNEHLKQYTRSHVKHTA